MDVDLPHMRYIHDHTYSDYYTHAVHQQVSNVHKYSKNSHEYKLSYGITMITAADKVNKSLPVVSIVAVVPLVFHTVQLYVPKTSITLWAMVSTV